MSDLVGNPEDRFSRVAAHIMLLFIILKIDDSFFISSLFHVFCRKFWYDNLHLHTGQPHYKAMFGVDRNRLCYK